MSNEAGARAQNPAAAKAGDAGVTGGAGEADSPKRQGDKLGPPAQTTTADDLGRRQDSPKPHGDQLGHAVAEAAKG